MLTSTGYFFEGSKLGGLIIQPSTTTPSPAPTLKNSIGGVRELRDLFLVFGAAAAHTYKLVIWQRDQFAQPRIIHAGESVKGVLPVGQNSVPICADEVTWSNSYRIGRTLERRAIEITLSRVIGRRDEV